jgi:hypothetical protein
MHNFVILVLTKFRNNWSRSVCCVCKNLLGCYTEFVIKLVYVLRYNRCVPASLESIKKLFDIEDWAKLAELEVGIFEHLSPPQPII